MVPNNIQTYHFICFLFRLKITPPHSPTISTTIPLSHTVDGSEIPNNHLECQKTSVNNGVDYLYPLDSRISSINSLLYTWGFWWIPANWVDQCEYAEHSFSRWSRNIHFQPEFIHRNSTLPKLRIDMGTPIHVQWFLDVFGWFGCLKHVWIEKSYWVQSGDETRARKYKHLMPQNGVLAKLMSFSNSSIETLCVCLCESCCVCL